MIQKDNRNKPEFKQLYTCRGDYLQKCIFTIYYKAFEMIFEMQPL